MNKIAILGTGNIGGATAKGLLNSYMLPAENLYLTKRNCGSLKEFSKLGCHVSSDNPAVVKEAQIIIVAVAPACLEPLLKEINSNLKHKILISLVAGVKLSEIEKQVNCPVVRAMPNIAIALGQSMTCLVSNDKEALEQSKEIFGKLGTILQINEEQMIAATVLGACGVAFFLRAIRAASQGGIEIGFQAQDALTIATQTAQGAASLLGTSGNHPESVIDKVTTPRGCTISGLNQMEHAGFSSAMIKGIITSANKLRNF